MYSRGSTGIAGREACRVNLRAGRHEVSFVRRPGGHYSGFGGPHSLDLGRSTLHTRSSEPAMLVDRLCRSFIILGEILCKCACEMGCV